MLSSTEGKKQDRKQDWSSVTSEFLVGGGGVQPVAASTLKVGRTFLAIQLEQLSLDPEGGERRSQEKQAL